MTEDSNLPLVPLDACCLLNLCATRQPENILRTLPLRAAVAEMAAGEVRFLRRGGAGPDANGRDAIDLQPLISSGLLTLLRLETDQEIATFVQFAADLDDGEAMTIALALRRGLAVATDDRKALKLLARYAPHLPTFTTAGLLHQWAGIQQPSLEELRRVLLDVQERARFAPGRHDPLQGWWQAALWKP